MCISEYFLIEIVEAERKMQLENACSCDVGATISKQQVPPLF